MDNFIEKNIGDLSDEYKKEFLIKFRADLEKYRAYTEKTGIGTFVMLNNLPETVLYKMHLFIQNRLPKIITE
jgi:hypothetical protein